MLKVSTGPAWYLEFPFSFNEEGWDPELAQEELLLGIPQSWSDSEFRFEKSFDFGKPASEKYNFSRDTQWHLPGWISVLYPPNRELNPKEERALARDDLVTSHSQVRGTVEALPLPPGMVISGAYAEDGYQRYRLLRSLPTFPSVVGGSGSISHQWFMDTGIGANRSTNKYILDTKFERCTDYDYVAQFTIRYFSVYDHIHSGIGGAFIVTETQETWRIKAPYNGESLCHVTTKVTKWEDRERVVAEWYPEGTLRSRHTAVDGYPSESTKWASLDVIYSALPVSDPIRVADDIGHMAASQSREIGRIPVTSTFPLISDIAKSLDPHALRAVETFAELFSTLVTLGSVPLVTLPDLHTVSRYRRMNGSFVDLLQKGKAFPQLFSAVLDTVGDLGRSKIAWLFAYQPTLREIRRGRVLARSTLKRKQEVRAQNSYTKAYMGRDVQVEQRMLVRARLHPRALNVFFTLERWGVIPLSSGFYSLVPYSWAFDWFLPFGDLLEDLDTYFVRLKMWNLTYRVSSVLYTWDFEPEVTGHYIHSDAQVRSYRRITSRYWPLPFSTEMDDFGFSLDNVNWGIVAALVAAKEK